MSGATPGDQPDCPQDQGDIHRRRKRWMDTGWDAGFKEARVVGDRFD
jgi:hypothetical protein